MKTTNTSGIYVLRCPITSRVRYVGQGQNLRQRESSYRSRRGRVYVNQRLQRWLNRLESEKLEVIFEPWLLTDDQRMKDKVERRLIKSYGVQLLNHRAGGLFCSKLSEAEKDRRSL